jgi:hypothetical protein
MEHKKTQINQKEKQEKKTTKKYDKGLFIFHRDFRLTDNIGLLNACSHCKELRKLQLQEISFNDFRIEFSKKSILHKFNWYRSRYAMFFHKNAGYNFYTKKYISFLVNITIATSLWPSYVFASLKNQFKK